MGPIDSALFKIKMDIMLIKNEVMQLKDDLSDYLSNIVNLHLGRIKNKLETGSKLNDFDCESGLLREVKEEDEECSDEEDYSGCECSDSECSGCEYSDEDEEYSDEEYSDEDEEEDTDKK